MRAIVVALLVLCGASRTDALPAFAGLPHLPAPTHLPPHNLKHIVLATVGFRGHYMPLLRLGAELATRGYRVSVATHSNAQDDVLRAGLHFLDMGRLPVPKHELRSKLQQITQDPSAFRGILSLFNEVYLPAVFSVYGTLLKTLQADPAHAMVVDMATLGATDVALRLQIPLVLNNPSLPFSIEGPPFYIPAWGTGFRLNMTLWERCMNVLFPRLLSVALTPPFMQLNKMRWMIGMLPHRSQHELFRHSRIVTSSALGFDYPRPVSPLVDHVGPMLPMQPFENATLPRPMLTWLKGGPRAAGVVYVSLGALTQLDATQAAELVQGLTVPGTQVLWTLTDGQLPALPAALPETFRVKRAHMLPHLKVLAHASVRAVVSHCGLAGAQEALYYGKPVLCLPRFGDQPDVAARVLDHGVGLSVDKASFAAATIRAKIQDLLANDTYTRAARIMAQVMRNAGGVYRAADIVEETLLVGSSVRVPPEAKLAWHRAVMMDVYAVYASIIFVVAVSVYLLWKQLSPALPRGARHLRAALQAAWATGGGGQARGRWEDLREVAPVESLQLLERQLELLERFVAQQEGHHGAAARIRGTSSGSAGKQPEPGDGISNFSSNTSSPAVRGGGEGASTVPSAGSGNAARS